MDFASSGSELFGSHASALSRGARDARPGTSRGYYGCRPGGRPSLVAVHAVDLLCARAEVSWWNLTRERATVETRHSGERHWSTRRMDVWHIARRPFPAGRWMPTGGSSRTRRSAT